MRVSFLAPVDAFHGGSLVRLLLELLVRLPVGLHVTFLTLIDDFCHGWLVRLPFGLLVELLVELLVGLRITFLTLVDGFRDGSPERLHVRYNIRSFVSTHFF